MKRVLFIILLFFIKFSFCSSESLLDKWATLVKEPTFGFGPYRFVPLHIGECEDVEKIENRDLDAWVTMNTTIEENKKDHNIKGTINYPQTVQIQSVTMKSWIRLNNQTRLILNMSVDKPCSYVLMRLSLKYLNPSPDCTIKKGIYSINYEKVDELMQSFVLYLGYSRYMTKVITYSSKGIIGCIVVIDQLVPRG